MRFMSFLWNFFKEEGMKMKQKLRRNKIGGKPLFDLKVTIEARFSWRYCC